MADQLRADYLGCYGANFVKTPNIDKLRNDGVLFDRAISPSPLCVPARASMLTGANAVVNGVLDNQRWLRPDRKACGVKTWPEILVETGYNTAAFGKMHFYPWDINEGFQERKIAEDKRHILLKDDYYDYLATFGLEKKHASHLNGYYENKGAVIGQFPEEHQVDRWVASRTCEYIDNYKSDKPFAVMVGFPGPHCPYDPPQKYLDEIDEDLLPDTIPGTKDSDKFRDYFIMANKLPWNGVDYTDFEESHKKKLKKHYCALINQIDFEFGRIIESLKRKNLYESTTIIFTADHGELMGDYNLMGKHYNFEPSIRVPLLIKNSRMEKDGLREGTVSLTDLFSTILDVAGVESYADPDDSKSLFSPESRSSVFGATDLGYMITDDNWKLCRHTNGAQMLFDLKNDPTEQNNLFNDAQFNDKKNDLDKILISRLTKSIMRSNDEKLVNDLGAIGDGGFEERGWQRTYPKKIF